jgi:hypothetical protein
MDAGCGKIFAATLGKKRVSQMLKDTLFFI